jgi:glucokinase
MLDYDLKIFDEKNFNKNFSKYVLGVDIGGTNTNIAVAGIEETKPILLFSLNFESQKLDSLIPALKETLNYAEKNFKIVVKFCCIGAAGVVSPNKDFAKHTKLSWDVNVEEILKKTSLEKTYIINDFQAIGYAVNLLDNKNQEDLFEIRSSKITDNNYETKVLIGAGTGLGKSILIFDKKNKTYVPIASEGGHVDFPVENEFELKLLEFIKNLRKISLPIIYEDLISGRGLEAIYLYLRKIKKYNKSIYTKEIDEANDKAPLISKYKIRDEACKETFKLFTKYYARCARNFVLETMATGGLYIAGGIATKNKEIFTSKEFIDEFEKSYKRNFVLKNIPIYIITNYDVSLLGTCYACSLFNKKN